MAITLLLNGKTGVSSEELVTNILRATFLGLEQVGVIRLEINAEISAENKTLLAVPTGKEVEFPENTLESRLDISRKRSVAAIIDDWLLVQNWESAAEQVMVLLSIRKLATVEKGKLDSFTYRYSEAGREAVKKESALRMVQETLENCKTTRPILWDLLNQEIQGVFPADQHEATAPKSSKPKVEQLLAEERRKAIEVGDYEKASSNTNVAWYAESAANRKMSGVELDASQKKKKPVVVIILVSGLLWWLLYYLATAYDVVLPAIIITLLVSMVYLLAAFKFKPIVQLFDWLKEASPVFAAMAKDGPSDELKEQIAAFLFIVSMVSTMLVGTLVGGFSLQLLMLGLLAYFIYGITKKKAQEAINEEVMGKPETPVVEPNTLVTGSSTVAVKTNSPEITTITAKEPPPQWESPIHFDILEQGELPPVSEESRQRLMAVTQRGPAHKKLYKKVLLALLLTVTAVELIFWFLGPYPFEFTSIDGGFSLPDGFPLLLLIFSVVSIIVVLRDITILDVLGDSLKMFIALGYVLSRKENASVEANNTVLIRPYTLILLTWFWLVLLVYLASTAHYSPFPVPAPGVYAIILLILSVGTFLWIRSGKKELEKKYPYYRPLNLLALRVFGTSYLSDFLNLTNSWQWLGIRQRLDGPNTVGGRTGDVFNYVLGRVGDSIVQDEAELQRALSDFKVKPDSQLRFPLNSMQCTNDTWKRALQHILDPADVIVMDLSGLSETNRGVAYELCQLFEQRPKDQLIFLVNDSTDMVVLTEIMNEAWSQKTSQSPNANLSNATIKLIHTGVSLERGAEESYHEWRKRTKSELDGEHLVCLLYDTAVSSGNIDLKPDPKMDKPFIKWTSILNPLLRTILLIFLIIVVLAFGNWDVLLGGIIDLFL